MKQFDVNKIREDFPILNEKSGKFPLVYFDNGATTQKPVKVLETIDMFLRKYNSNIHRGVHTLSQKMTGYYEDARDNVRNFLNAESSKEIIFTSGTTNSINLVASSFGEKFVNEGDEVIISYLEHHSNIVPWQLLCQRKKAVLKVIPMNDNGELVISELDSLVTDRTRIISVSHISNALGTINPIKKIIQFAHKKGIPVLVDGAQAIQHLSVDVKDLDCDFYAFSGHKIYAPTGIGILYGKEKWLNEMPPYQGGGDMIKKVSFQNTTFADLPFKFEAGTTNFIGAVGLSAAIDYVNSIGLSEIAEYESQLLGYATKKLSEIDGLRIYGTSEQKSAVISFLLDDIHFFDAGEILNSQNIAVRTGHHCAQPLMDFLKIEGTVRASFAFYNTFNEVDQLYEGLLKVKKLFS